MRKLFLCRDVEILVPGDHVCCLFDTDDEHRMMVKFYMERGLKRSEKVMYLTDSHSAHCFDSILDDLCRSDLKVESCLINGQLEILSAEKVHMNGGGLDPDHLISFLFEKTDHAIEEGYRALRVIVEMGWVLDGMPGSQRLFEHQLKISRFLKGNPCVVLSHYDQRRFNPPLLLHTLTTHPVISIGTKLYPNQWYMVPPVLSNGERPGAALKRWLSALTGYSSALM